MLPASSPICFIALPTGHPPAHHQATDFAALMNFQQNALPVSIRCPCPGASGPQLDSWLYCALLLNTGDNVDRLSASFQAKIYGVCGKIYGVSKWPFKWNTCWLFWYWCWSDWATATCCDQGLSGNWLFGCCSHFCGRTMVFPFHHHQLGSNYFFVPMLSALPKTINSQTFTTHNFHKEWQPYEQWTRLSAS